MIKNQKLEKLVVFYEHHSRMPSFSEMLRLWNYKSKNSVYKLVNKLAEEGLVKRDKNGKLLPTGYFSEIAVLGTIEAGFPSPAEEELVDTISLDEYLIKNREATYMLKASGDSMKDAGIVAGDMVLVDRSKTPKDGDVVVAEVDSKWTMKYLRKRGDKTYLEAANSKYKPIHPKSELKIAAVVIAIIRKYK